MANEYATVNELKATLELSGQSFADDDITLALTAASRAVDRHTRRRFWVDADADQVRYYTPADAAHLLIDDLVTLTALAGDDAGDGTFTESWTLNTDFVLEPLNAAADGEPYTAIRVHHNGSRYFRPGHVRSVRVTGKFGWAVVPDEVKQATKIVAAKLVKRAREAPFGVVGFGMDGAAVRIVGQDPDVIGLLQPFVSRPGIA